MEEEVSTLREVEQQRLEQAPPVVATHDNDEKPSEGKQKQRFQHWVVVLLLFLLALAIGGIAALGGLYGVEKNKSDDIPREDSSCCDDGGGTTNKTINITSFLNVCNELEAKELPLERDHDDTSESGQVYNFPQCDDGTGNPNYMGTLYKWTGTGRVTSVETCDDRTSFDSYLSVYQCSENGLFSCVGANNDMGQELCLDGGTNSQVQWSAEQDMNYYILVHGNGDGSMGQFEMYVNQGEEIPEPRISMTCRDLKADSLILFDGEDETLTAPVYDYFPSCEDDGIPNYQGVLYYWSGRDRWMTVDTCYMSSNTYDTYISVYECDDESNELSCITANNDGAYGCSIGESSLMWPAKNNVNYFILVHGNGNVAMGTFDLNVNEGDEIETSTTATCGSLEFDAYPLQLSYYYYDTAQFGYTKNTFVYNNVLPECQEEGDPNYQGNLYYFQGNGKWAIAEISCGSPTDYDTYISVYECSNDGELSCATANNDHGDCSHGASKVQWPAEDGHNYFLLVHGNGDDEAGIYELEISSGHDLADKSMMSCGTQTFEVLELDYWDNYIGDTSDAAVIDFPICEDGGDPNYQGILYHWEGRNKWVDVIIACGSDYYDTYLSVYECDQETGELFCVTANDDRPSCGDGASTASWPAEEGHDYIILVHGKGSGDNASGRFQIGLDEGRELPVASTVTCGASYLEVFELQDWDRYTGDTSDAPIHDLPTCEDGGNPNYQGIFYYWEGRGKFVDVGISCYYSQYDTYMSVYECDDTTGLLSCVAANDNRTGCHNGASRVYWPAEDGSKYFVLVHGKGSGDDATGRFEIESDEGSSIPTPVSPCGNVTALAINFGTIIGDTSSASTYDIPACEDDGTPNYQGILYGIVGTDSLVTANTCDWSTEFDTYISVYTCGTDGELSCLASNNDLNRLCSYNQHSSELLWLAQREVEYYILVHGNNLETGEFELHINVRIN